MMGVALVTIVRIGRLIAFALFPVDWIAVIKHRISPCY
jgi:hypothetical protein